MKYTYSIACPFLDGWDEFIKYQSKGFCEGYITAVKSQGLRKSLRVIRSDGKIVYECDEKSKVSLGMIAGFPTSEDYERAGQEALVKAGELRQREQN